MFSRRKKKKEAEEEPYILYSGGPGDDAETPEIRFYEDRIVFMPNVDISAAFWDSIPLGEIRHATTLFGGHEIGDTFIVLLEPCQQRLMAEYFQKHHAEQEKIKQEIAKKQEIEAVNRKNLEEFQKTEAWIKSHVRVLQNGRPCRVSGDGFVFCNACGRQVEDSEGKLALRGEKIQQRKSYSAEGYLFCAGCQNVYAYSITVRR